MWDEEHVGRHGTMMLINQLILCTLLWPFNACATLILCDTCQLRRPPQSHAGCHSLLVALVIKELSMSLMSLMQDPYHWLWHTATIIFISKRNETVCAVAGRTWTQMQTFMHGKINFELAALFAGKILHNITYRKQTKNLEYKTKNKTLGN